MGTAHTDFWRSRLTTPAYRVGEAASYVRTSPQTVASWHRRSHGARSAVVSDKEKREGLSFLQLIEVAVVAEMRRVGVKLGEIARAREYFIMTTGLIYPFAQLKFKTDGADVLRDDDSPISDVAVEKMISANRNGQYIWTGVLSVRLKEFNYDEAGSVRTWHVAGYEKPVVIDPRVAFGAPQVKGVRTRAIKAKWVGGLEVDEIADDYAILAVDVVEALFFEGIFRENPRLAKWIN